jgi:hypothetical protein
MAARHLSMRRRYSRIPVVPIVGALLHTAAGSLARAEVASFSDPFAYCAAVGTADTPGPRYTGPAMPEAVARGLGAVTLSALSSTVGGRRSDVLAARAASPSAAVA